MIRRLACLIVIVIAMILLARYLPGNAGPETDYFKRVAQPAKGV